MDKITYIPRERVEKEGTAGEKIIEENQSLGQNKPLEILIDKGRVAETTGFTYWLRKNWYWVAIGGLSGVLLWFIARNER